jgi:PAS domain S-box-containing protein
MRSLARDLFAILGAATGYYVCAVVGTLLSVPPSGFAIIWPATAFLISVFLIVPKKRWWLCVAGVVPTHFYIAATLQPHAPFPVVLTQIAGNLVLALATVLAVRKTIGKQPRFDTVGSVLTFILVAGFAVPAVVNALILSVHLATGWINDLWLSWRQWMIACIFPTVTIPPVALLASTNRLTGRPSAASHPLLELIVLVTLVFGISVVVFGSGFDATHWPALFLAPFPLLIWTAVRLGVGGTSLSLLVLAAAIVVQALRHNGPFAVQTPIEDVTSLQMFLIASSIPLILLAALMDERRRTISLLRQSEARMQIAASSGDTGLWQWDERAQQLWLTQHCCEMFGLTNLAAPTPFSFLAAIHPEDRTRLDQAIRAALRSNDSRPAQDYRIECNGKTRWLLLSTESEFDRAGKVQVSGAFRDITDRVIAQLETDQLRQRVVRIREDERRRLAEELHDSTAQHLVAARLDLSLLKSKVRTGATRNLLVRIMKSVHEASMEVRTFSYLLHPPQLGRSGLAGVLQHYVPGFESRTGVRTSLRISPFADQLSAEQQHAILRIAQESLGNVHRHARAKRVSISVRCISGNVHLVVSDDGKGISLDEGRQLSERLHLGVGIPGMTARVQRLGGRIDVNSGATGTTVHVAIPLSHPFTASVH